MGVALDRFAAEGPGCGLVHHGDCKSRRPQTQTIGCGTLGPCRGSPSCSLLRRLRDSQDGGWDELVAVPYFDGLMAGEPDALVESFAGEPELHHPVRGTDQGRAGVRGVRRRDERVAQRGATSRSRTSSTSSREPRGFEEVVLHLDGETGRVELPVAIVADREPDGRIDELRIYFSSWPLTGRHANRPPLLQPDPELRESDIVGRVPACARGRRRRRDRGGIRAGRLRPRARGRRAHPPRPRGPARLLRAAVLERRRHPAGALRAHRRRARVRARVQRRALGQDRAAAAGRGGRLRSRSRAASSPPPASTTTPTPLGRLSPASVPGGLTAVDVQGLAGDEGGPFEVEDPVDDVADLAQPAERVKRGHAP